MGTPLWSCTTTPALAPPCPSSVPNDGTPCALPEGTNCPQSSCFYLTGTNVRCTGGFWRWSAPNICPVCASPDTPVATPSGDRPIAELGVGDLVYSVDGAAIRAVPIARINQTPVSGHQVVRIVTEGGATLEISAGHPTADGRRFGDLGVGDRLDGRRIESAAVIPYRFTATYDILPLSKSGTYFAAGMLIGSTLK
jgi:hypothetical protein